MRRIRDFAKDTLDSRYRSDTLDGQDTRDTDFVPKKQKLSHNPKDRPEYVSQLACYRKFHRSSSQLFNDLKLMRVVSDDEDTQEEEEEKEEEEEESLESLMYVFQVLNTKTAASEESTKPPSVSLIHPTQLPLQQVLSPQVMDSYTESMGQSSDQNQPSVFSDLTQPSTPQSSAAETHEPQLRFCPEVEMVVYQRKYPLLKSTKWQDLLRLKRSNYEPEYEEWIEPESKPILKSRSNKNQEREMATVRKEDQLSVDDFLKRLETYDTIREEMQDYFACKRDHLIYRYNRQLREP